MSPGKVAFVMFLSSTLVHILSGNCPALKQSVSAGLWTFLCKYDKVNRFAQELLGKVV